MAYKTSVDYARALVGDKSDGRPKDDFYPTPPELVDDLVRKESFIGRIWEPACGDGAISTRLIEHGYDVISTDLYDRGFGTSGIDFLATSEPLAPIIITNPPFKLATEFIRHAMMVLKIDKMALLLKLTALEGAERSRVLEQSNLRTVYVYRRRVLLTRNGEKQRGSGMIAFAWFVFDNTLPGKQPCIDWI